MIDYTKTYVNPYLFAGMAPDGKSVQTTETPYHEQALRRGLRRMAIAYLIFSTADGPLPFGDVVAIAFSLTYGTVLLGYWAYGNIQDVREARQVGVTINPYLAEYIRSRSS